MNGLRKCAVFGKYAVLGKCAVLTAAIVGLAACGTGVGFRNVLDGNEYRLLTAWPLLCHSDGSIILVQKTNEAGGLLTPRRRPNLAPRSKVRSSPRGSARRRLRAHPRRPTDFSAATTSSGVTVAAAGCSKRRARSGRVRRCDLAPMLFWAGPIGGT